MATTADDRQQVLEFYDRRLTGWKQLYAANIQGGVARTYQDGDGARVLSVTVMVAKEHGPTQIMLMHMRQQ
jgi:hypothetical protein